MEMEEAKRLHEEKLRDLEPINEDERIEWDGLRRRRTMLGTNPSTRSRGNSSLPPLEGGISYHAHPPLGMSQFPDLNSDNDDEENRPSTGGLGSSFFGSIRSRAKSMVVPGQTRNLGTGTPNIQSPMHPVPLTEISIPTYKASEDGEREAYYGLPVDLRDLKTTYKGAAGGSGRHIAIVDEAASQRTGSRESVAPTPPPHSARRQFSFQNVFRKGQQAVTHSEEALSAKSPLPRLGLGIRQSSHLAIKGATEEERLGLVKGNSTSMPQLPVYEDEESDEDEWKRLEDKARERGSPPRGQSNRGSPERAGRGLTPPRAGQGREWKDKELEAGVEDYEQQGRRWNESRGPPPPFDDGKGSGGAGAGAGAGAFI